jgi:hypothetical protein
MLQNVLPVDPPLDEIAGIEAHRPRKGRGIVESRCAGGGKQLRYLLRIEVFLHGRVRRGADDLERQQDFVTLDQLAHPLDGLWRAICVVILDQVDHAAVDAAPVVDHLDIGRLGLADRRIGGGRSAQRHGLSHLDFRIGGTGIIFLLRMSGRHRQGDGDRRRGHQVENAIPHRLYSSSSPAARITPRHCASLR